MKVFLLIRHDHRGCNPIKVFAIKDNAKQYCGECNVAVKLMLNSEDPVSELDLIKEFDSGVEFCYTLKYTVEEIQTE